MHNILCLNKISPLGTDRLGENYTYAAEIENPEGILVRSAAMHAFCIFYCLTDTRLNCELHLLNSACAAHKTACKPNFCF